MSDWYESSNTGRGVQRRDRSPQHYYGDIVRTIFLLTGVAILLEISIYRDELSLPFYIVILLAVGLAFLAGYTSPRHPAVMRADMLFSFMAALIFQYLAVYQSPATDHPVFLINQALAITFFIAGYFATKTYRFFREYQGK